MSLTYSTYVTSLANLMVVDATNAEFLVVLPNIIDDAEQRIYRELDILNTVVRDTSSFVTANTREFALPTAMGRFVTVQNINVITPTGYTVGTGTRNSLTPVSRAYLDMTWPTNVAVSASSVPSMFAMVSDQQTIVGQSPGVNYNVEVVGTIRPTPLSSTNTTTYLSLYLPDLFLAASMVFASGYMRNFGAQQDDPRMAVSWEAVYAARFASANVEEQRKRFAAGGWTSQSPSPIATPPRQ
jgi:hypothetical protein